MAKTDTEGGSSRNRAVTFCICFRRHCKIAGFFFGVEYTNLTFEFPEMIG